jgi:hypothetical protein
MNAARGLILRFCIFRGERIRDDFIKNKIFGTCVVVQTKAWMKTFLFKEFLSFFKRIVPSGIFPNNRHLLILDGLGSHVSLQAICRNPTFGRV